MRAELLEGVNAIQPSAVRERTTNRQNTSKVRLHGEEVRNALSTAFQRLGGIDGLVSWGLTNPEGFYKLWVRLLPHEIRSAGNRIPQGENELKIEFVSRDGDRAHGAKVTINGSAPKELPLEEDPTSDPTSALISAGEAIGVEEASASKPATAEVRSLPPPNLQEALGPYPYQDNVVSIVSATLDGEIENSDSAGIQVPLRPPA